MTENPAIIPSAGQWFVYSSGRWMDYGVKRADIITPKLAKFRRESGRFGQIPLVDIVACFDNRAAANALRDSIYGVIGSFKDRRFNERKRYEAAMKAIEEKQSASIARVIAQAIEARRAETGTGSVHESAVLEEDAPKSTGN